MNRAEKRRLFCEAGVFFCVKKENNPNLRRAERRTDRFGSLGKSNKQEVLQSEHKSIPKKLLTFLFGEFCEVLVLTPGETVQGIEIKEMRGDGNE